MYSTAEGEGAGRPVPPGRQLPSDSSRRAAEAGHGLALPLEGAPGEAEGRTASSSPGPSSRAVSSDARPRARTRGRPRRAFVGHVVQHPLHVGGGQRCAAVSISEQPVAPRATPRPQPAEPSIRRTCTSGLVVASRRRSRSGREVGWTQMSSGVPSAALDAVVVERREHGVAVHALALVLAGEGGHVGDGAPLPRTRRRRGVLRVPGVLLQGGLQERGQGFDAEPAAPGRSSPGRRSGGTRDRRGASAAPRRSGRSRSW